LKTKTSKQQQQIQYWLTAAEKDLPVMEHLFEKGDYHWALFIGHLVLEKMLKAFYVKNVGKVPPYKHSLILLAKKAKLSLNEEQEKVFETFTNFNIEARYPDDKFEFYKLCTKEFTGPYIKQTKEYYQWLKTLIKSE
jgi:HEPN domain-containing protein